MCRSDIDTEAQKPLARLLWDMARALAAEFDVDAEDVRIGPVDFGGEAS